MSGGIVRGYGGSRQQGQAWEQLILLCWTYHIWAVLETNLWKCPVGTWKIWKKFPTAWSWRSVWAKSWNQCWHLHWDHKVFTEGTGCWKREKKEKAGILGRGSSLYKGTKLWCNQRKASNWMWLMEGKTIYCGFPTRHFPTIRGTGHRPIISMGKGVFVWKWHSVTLWINQQILKSRLLGSLMFLYELNCWSISGINGYFLLLWSFCYKSQNMSS